jgi:hypothetical protein
MLASPALIDRSMTYYWAGVSGKGNRIIPRWRPNKKRKVPTSITTVRDKYLSFATFPTPLCFSLVITFNVKQLASCVIIIHSGVMAVDDRIWLAVR